MLEGSLRGKDDEMASYFRGLHQQWFHARLSSLGIEITERDLDLKIFKEDLFIFTVLMKLTSLVDDEFLHEDGHLGFQMIMNTLDKIGPAMYGNLLHSENSKCVTDADPYFEGNQGSCSATETGRVIFLAR